MSQDTLSRSSGVSRITIARLESANPPDIRTETLEKLCQALDLEISVVQRGVHPDASRRLARERARANRLDARRRHAALAATLLALDPTQAEQTVEHARANVRRWAAGELCSRHYIERWSERLQGPVRAVALRLLEHDEWTDALLQNSPWSFALAPAAA